MHTFRRLVSSLVVLLPCATAHAATYVVPTDDALVGKARAIVIAHALTSYAEESEKHGIETVTVLSVEDVLKGDLSSGAEIKVRVIGGLLEKKIKVIPGAPRFVDGERVLVLLNEFDAGYVVTDFALGLFRFDTDETGREVLIRSSEIHGWNEDGSVHREVRRDADLFLTYVRGIARHLPAKNNYFVDAQPLISDVPRQTPPGRLRQISNPCDPCTATQYSFSSGAGESDPGMRWNVFPGAANYNKGNSASNATNGGTDAINNAFSNWNSDAQSNTNLVLATSNADLDGITDAPDSVNNIVFEEDLPGLDYSCMGGGLLGLGGMQSTSGTSMVNGETFLNTLEVDVSMNKGVNACIGVTLSQSNFDSAVTHEVGHTIGFRHSDQNRRGLAACSTQPTYDCSGSAIMTGAVTFGPLQTWDISAVRALYPGGSPPAAPTGVVATATSASSVTVNWTPVGGATSYEVDRKAPGGIFTQVGTPGSPPFVNNTGLSANTAYLYRVRAVSGGGTSSNSLSDLATTTIFTDDPYAAATTLVKATHLSQLRTAVTTVRDQAGVGAPTFTDSASAGVTIKAVHVTELRTQLDAAMSALGLTTGGYTDGALGGVQVKAVHFQQLADRVK